MSNGTPSKTNKAVKQATQKARYVALHIAGGSGKRTWERAPKCLQGGDA